MIAKGISVEMWFYTGRVPDEMNHTELVIDGKLVWGDDESPVPSIETGQQVEISIPSGVLTGKAVNVKGNEVYLDNATWAGRWGGLDSGLSGCAHWEVIGGGTVSTSASPVPVAFRDYENAQRLCDPIAFGHPELKRRMLTEALRIVRIYCKRIKEGEAG